MLQAAMIAAPLVMQGVSIIGSLFGRSKAKKAQKAMNAQLGAQNAQQAQALNQMISKTMGPIGQNYLAQQGIKPGEGGLPTMGAGQLPGAFAA